MANFGSILGDVLKNYANIPQTPNDVTNLSHNDVYNHYQQLTQQVPPQHVYEAHQQAYQQIPQPQRESVFSSLLGALTQNGINPLQTGIQGNNPSAQNFAQISQYISQRPDLLQSVFGQGGTLNSPIAKMVLAGALAVAANKFSGGKL